ncbi:uncharacterized protein LOC143915338 [Arctopsyche grandis]|uniref:uncharacterized protein LOC143915338 n=1 Tax=Arctopsyche grandis TaxID=121162 RepID=UPI00406D6AD7
MWVSESFVLYYQNVRGLNSKASTCLSAVLAQDIDLIALTETWLTDSVMDAETRYLVFRRDGGFGGGGVILAVRTDAIKSARHLPHLDTIGKHLWVFIELSHETIFIFPSTTNLSNF